MKRLIVALFAIAAGLAIASPSEAASTGPTVLDGTPICGLAAPAPGSTPVADDGVLKVASFNLLHSDLDEADMSLADRLPLEADALAASGADIIGAQEVARNTDFTPGDEYPQRHGFVAQRLAEMISARTGEAWTWCWSASNPHVPLTPDITTGGGNPLDALAVMFGNIPDSGTFSEGLAILTRFPVQWSRFHRMLPRSYEAVACLNLDPFCRLDATFDARQVLWARIATPLGGVDMFTTHIAHHIGGLSNTTKLLQARQAMQVVKNWSVRDALPDFLVGDFNSAPGGKVWNTVTNNGFVDTYRAAGGVECVAPGDAGCSGGPPDGGETYTAGPTRAMSERIDYVWARRGSCGLAVTNSQLIGNTPTLQSDGRYIWPSDHNGFVSTVRCNA